MTIKQTAGRDALGDFAPKFAQLNDDVLFGEVWSREGELSLRDRSVVTVVALMAQGLTDSSFQYHLMSAKNNGVTRAEIAEILTHAAFYAGWPKAWAAFRMAKEVWADGRCRRCKSRAPKRDGLSHRCPQRRVREVLYRAKLPRAPFHRAGRRLQRYVRARLPQQLAHTSRQKRWRADPRLRGWSRALPGMGQTGTRAAPWRCSEYSRGRKALARSRARQLVLPSRGGGSGRGDLQRVVGARGRRAIP